MSDDTMTLEEAQAEIAKLKLELEMQSTQAEEHLNGWKRAKADYVNFKNDQEKRSKELAQFASMSTLLGYLPIVDNFRMAFEHLPKELESSEWVKGIQLIYTQMREMLKTMGVEEYTATVGSAFDPAEHQAVGQEQREDIEDDAISQEVGSGYRFHGKVIVPAKVIVNKKTIPNA